MKALALSWLLAAGCWHLRCLFNQKVPHPLWPVSQPHMTLTTLGLSDLPGLLKARVAAGLRRFQRII